MVIIFINLLNTIFINIIIYLLLLEKGEISSYTVK